MFVATFLELQKKWTLCLHSFQHPSTVSQYFFFMHVVMMKYFIQFSVSFPAPLPLECTRTRGLPALDHQRIQESLSHQHMKKMCASSMTVRHEMHLLSSAPFSLWKSVISTHENITEIYKIYKKAWKCRFCYSYALLLNI